MKKNRHIRIKSAFQFVVLLFFLASAPFCFAATYLPPESADRAVEIAKQSRDRVERNGKRLKASSHALFSEFAERTGTLQKLIDTREKLEKAGFLAKGDPDGEARRAHINAKILMEVGGLKKACDKHLDSLLDALESFDETVVASLVDSQATRSINSNYELTLDRYLKKERSRFEKASKDAQAALIEYQEAKDPNLKKRLFMKYNRAKKRLLKIEQRRKIYEARIKAAALNQKIAGLIREKIRAEGNDIPTRFREVMMDLYNTFAKIIPVAEVGGTGSPEILANMGFSNIQEVRDILDTVGGASVKLGGVLDNMVNDVMAGLNEIQIINDTNISSETFSVEEEMDFLSKQRESWVQ